MTIKELEKIAQSNIKVLSARTGKVLCQRYIPERHGLLQDSEIRALWTEITVNNNGGFTSFARPIICVYVSEVNVNAE